MFHSFIYQPLYNLFILLSNWLPFFDAGMIVILFTLIVKTILFPLSKKAYLSQIEMRKLQPKLEEVKRKYKDNKEEQARKLMEAYKEAKTNPFSGILVLIIQIPVILALYYILIKAGLPQVDMSLLYNFIPNPGTIDMTFFGFSLLTQKNIVLALLAGITSYIQIKIATANQPAIGGNEALAKMMKIQMKVMFPILAFVVSWQISGVVGLYWATSNVFTIVQDLYLNKKYKVAAV